MNMSNIEWTPPKPRAGMLGTWDKFVGPGATSHEEWLQLGGGVVLMLAFGVLLYSHRAGLNWTPLQIGLVGLLAFDLIGGIITNATSTAKRWYHRTGQEGFSAHIPFVAVHGLHLFIVAALFRNTDWSFFILLYGYLLLSSVVILRSPLYLQRPVSFVLYCGAVLLGMYVFTPTPGLEWFVPFFYLKLLVSHLVKEAPFTPESR
jgi:uncharacterized membrane protein YuzA (DUF378 family)